MKYVFVMSAVLPLLGISKSGAAGSRSTNITIRHKGGGGRSTNITIRHKGGDSSSTAPVTVLMVKVVVELLKIEN